MYAAFSSGTTTTVVNDVPVSGQTQEAAARGDLTVNAIYQHTYQGVVEITVSSTSQSFFGGTETSEAQGSGFVYDSQGDIVTNEHVVAGANSISVRLWNGRAFTGHLVRSDSSTDLAVVKISAPSSLLHPLALADSNAVQVGDPVVAIGSPFGLPETVTSGIVSALNRTIQSPNNYPIDGAIQTDAAINHGNSGGPLLNGTGEVIGINAQIHSDSGANDGVGFAIPSDTVKSVVSQIVEGKAVAYPYFGVRVQDSTTPPGALLAEVLPGTPAAKAGLENGDIVVKLGGEPITSAAGLTAVIQAKKPGDELSVTYVRLSRPHTATVTLTTRPS